MFVELQNYHPRVPIIYGRSPLGIPVTLFVCFTPYHGRDTVQTLNLKTPVRGGPLSIPGHKRDLL